MKIFFMLMCLVLMGCENKGEDLPEVSIQPQRVSYVGTDIDGERRVCEASPNLTCTAIFTPEDQFANDCEDRGYQAVACGCHDYICLDGSEAGLDLDGNHRSCNPMPAETFCSMEFTEEDQFAFDCRASGRKSIQCGCHDWICQ
ncbi:MAG: hypothetical protein H0V66_04265 [Bdellovibrionales bacterium]|nr:hypothetical protein [Bdellovibrionales bacterium]